MKNVNNSAEQNSLAQNLKLKLRLGTKYKRANTHADTL